MLFRIYKLHCTVAHRRQNDKTPRVPTALELSKSTLSTLWHSAIALEISVSLLYTLSSKKKATYSKLP